MPKTLNPVNTFPANIPNFPLSGNNEPLALGPLEAAFQALLNRTEHTRLRVDGLEGGVKRVQRFASRAALSAASGFADGDTVDVEGYGRYRLYNPSALTADGLWVLTAAGGGRWVHVLNDLRGASSGLATLTGGGRLSQDVRDGSILTAHLADGSVTSAKFAAGAVVGHLGYTPLNKAGDTMTGPLTVGGKTLQEIAFQPTAGVGWYRIVANVNVFGGRLDIYAEWGAKVSRISIEGYNAGYGNPNLGAFNAVQVFHYSSALITEIRWGNSGANDACLDIYVADVGGRGSQPIYLKFWGDAWYNIQSTPAYNPAVPSNSEKLLLINRTLAANSISAMGTISGLYDHTNRFAVSVFLGGLNSVSVPGGGSQLIGQISVDVPSGKSLYLRRVRSASALSARVGTTEAQYIAASPDIDANVFLASGGTLTFVAFRMHNGGASAQTLSTYDGMFAELEIR